MVDKLLNGSGKHSTSTLNVIVEEENYTLAKGEMYETTTIAFQWTKSDFRIGYAGMTNTKAWGEAMLSSLSKFQDK